MNLPDVSTLVTALTPFIAALGGFVLGFMRERAKNDKKAAADAEADAPARLPSAPPSQAERVTGEYSSPGFSITGQRILLVDDHDGEAAIVREVTRGLNVHVVAVETAEEAIELKRREGYRLALVDVGLPGLQGPELVARLKTVVLLYSGRSDEDLRNLAIECGADGWIRKTHDLPALRRRIAEYLK